MAPPARRISKGRLGSRLQADGVTPNDSSRQGDWIMKKLLLTLLFILALAAAALAQPNKPLLMRTPSLSQTQIAFSYAGDLWVVSREGGEATRLTNGVGNEFGPIFSPDGRWIA